MWLLGYPMTGLYLLDSNLGSSVSLVEKEKNKWVGKCQTEFVPTQHITLG